MIRLFLSCVVGLAAIWLIASYVSPNPWVSIPLGVGAGIGAYMPIETEDEEEEEED
jgi:hypothetical protein